MKEFLKEASSFLWVCFFFFLTINNSAQIEGIFNLKKPLDSINILAVLICVRVHCSCWLMQENSSNCYCVLGELFLIVFRRSNSHIFRPMCDTETTMGERINKLQRKHKYEIISLGLFVSFWFVFHEEPQCYLLKQHVLKIRYD